jgi:monoamine oxidase
LKYDIIIIGAGAAGLMAMRELAGSGHSICLLEAAPVAGGRICTIKETGFDKPVEAGAEFIHGKLPLTMKLLKEGDISYEAVAGKMISVNEGKWEEEEEYDEHWDEFMRQLKKLRSDLSIRQFLDQYFSAPEYSKLRGAVQRFAEGFDLADISQASVLAIGKEWAHGMETQYRIRDGYGKLIDHLLVAARNPNSDIHFNACINKIKYRRDHVEVFTTDSRKFEASKMILTVSAGVLQSGSLEFEPIPDTHMDAIQKLGFGSVIKILLQFRSAFWKKHKKDIGFLLTDEEIPTWWTQLPGETPLITGWLGGPRAAAKAGETTVSMLQSSLWCVSNLFRVSPGFLEQELVHHKIISWSDQPYAKGGYSYDTCESAAAKRILSQPVQDTIFFAGEAFFEGESQGTVEAALQSGRDVAEMVKNYRV